MSQKVVIIADPGIDTAYAITAALLSPEIEVLAIIATAGNIPAEQATKNVHLLINVIDPPRWPRLGSALPIEYPIDGTKLHGPTGLGSVDIEGAIPHKTTPGDKLLSELVRAHPNQITVIVLGPATTLARAIDRDADIPYLLQKVIFVGGSWREPGNASAVAEFHFFCDPMSAKRVLHAGLNLSLIPLDVSRKLVLSPNDLLNLPGPDDSICGLLRRMVPYGIRASSHLYGIEGFHLKDVLGIAALCSPGALTTEHVFVDVELNGELTRGMSVVDTRPSPAKKPNVELATSLDVVEVRQWLHGLLGRSKRF